MFLDRDGVLIEAQVRDNKPYAAESINDVRVIAGVREACAELKRLGFLLVLVTNQPDVARGRITREFVDEVNRRLLTELGLDAAQVCDHDDADDCACRKPKPGLMIEAAENLSIDLAASFVVGDRWRDIEAGRRAGCRTVFVDHGYDEKLSNPPDHTAPSLSAAMTWLRAQA